MGPVKLLLGSICQDVRWRWLTYIGELVFFGWSMALRLASHLHCQPERPDPGWASYCSGNLVQRTLHVCRNFRCLNPGTFLHVNDYAMVYYTTVVPLSLAYMYLSPRSWREGGVWKINALLIRLGTITIHLLQLLLVGPGNVFAWSTFVHSLAKDRSGLIFLGYWASFSLWVPLKIHVWAGALEALLAVAVSGVADIGTHGSVQLTAWGVLSYVAVIWVMPMLPIYFHEQQVKEQQLRSAAQRRAAPGASGSNPGSSSSHGKGMQGKGTLVEAAVQEAPTKEKLSCYAQWEQEQQQQQAATFTTTEPAALSSTQQQALGEELLQDAGGSDSSGSISKTKPSAPRLGVSEPRQEEITPASHAPAGSSQAVGNSTLQPEAAEPAAQSAGNGITSPFKAAAMVSPSKEAEGAILGYKAKTCSQALSVKVYNHPGTFEQDGAALSSAALQHLSSTLQPWCSLYQAGRRAWMARVVAIQGCVQLLMFVATGATSSPVSCGLHETASDGDSAGSSVGAEEAVALSDAEAAEAGLPLDSSRQRDAGFAAEGVEQLVEPLESPVHSFVCSSGSGSEGGAVRDASAGSGQQGSGVCFSLALDLNKLVESEEMDTPRLGVGYLKHLCDVLPNAATLGPVDAHVFQGPALSYDASSKVAHELHLPGTAGGTGTSLEMLPAGLLTGQAVQLLWVERAVVDADVLAQGGTIQEEGGQEDWAEACSVVLHTLAQLPTPVRVLVIDSTGRVVLEQNEVALPGLHSIRLDARDLQLQDAGSPPYTALHLVLTTPVHSSPDSTSSSCSSHSSHSSSRGQPLIYGCARLLLLPSAAASEMWLLWEDMLDEVGASNQDALAAGLQGDSGGPEALCMSAAYAWEHYYLPLLGDVAFLLDYAANSSSKGEAEAVGGVLRAHDGGMAVHSSQHARSLCEEVAHDLCDFWEALGMQASQVLLHSLVSDARLRHPVASCACLNSRAARLAPQPPGTPSIRSQLPYPASDSFDSSAPGAGAEGSMSSMRAGLLPGIHTGAGRHIRGVRTSARSLTQVTPAGHAPSARAYSTDGEVKQSLQQAQEEEAEEEEEPAGGRSWQLAAGVIINMAVMAFFRLHGSAEGPAAGPLLLSCAWLAAAACCSWVPGSGAGKSYVAAAAVAHELLVRVLLLVGWLPLAHWQYQLLTSPWAATVLLMVRVLQQQHSTCYWALVGGLNHLSLAALLLVGPKGPHHGPAMQGLSLSFTTDDALQLVLGWVCVVVLAAVLDMLHMHRNFLKEQKAIVQQQHEQLQEQEQEQHA